MTSEAIRALESALRDDELRLTISLRDHIADALAELLEDKLRLDWAFEHGFVAYQTATSSGQWEEADSRDALDAARRK